MSSQLLKINMPNLIKLGYKNQELQWLNNGAIQLMKTNIISHNHFSNLSFNNKYHLVVNNLKFKEYLNEIYTAILITSVLHRGFDSWANYNVHLDYCTILDNFYSQKTCNTVSLGNKLLTHQFIKPAEYKQLQHFRSIQRDSKIGLSDIYQLMMSANISS